MKELFTMATQTEDKKSIQVAELPLGGVQIETVIMTEEGISGSRIALSEDSTKALIKMLKEWEEGVL